jgi:hypothetical protein
MGSASPSKARRFAAHAPVNIGIQQRQTGRRERSLVSPLAPVKGLGAVVFVLLSAVLVSATVVAAGLTQGREIAPLTPKFKPGDDLWRPEVSPGWALKDSRLAGNHQHRRGQGVGCRIAGRAHCDSRRLLGQGPSDYRPGDDAYPHRPACITSGSQRVEFPSPDHASMKPTRPPDSGNSREQG